MKQFKLISFVLMISSLFFISYFISSAETTTCQAPEIIGLKNIVYEIGQGEPNYLEGLTVKSYCNDGLDTSKIKVDKDYVDLNTVGVYPVHFFLGDKFSHTVSKTINIDVRYDITAPSIIGLKEDYTYEVSTNLTDNMFTDGVTLNDNKDLSPILNVDISQIDVNKLGDYLVTFIAKDEDLNEKRETRPVHIVDTQKPVVTVNNPTLEVHSEKPDWNSYLTITDNYDDKFNVTFEESVDLHVLNNYTVHYKVSDQSGNLTEGDFTVHIVDTTAPVIEVRDRDTTVYNEIDLKEFITVTDNYDGTLNNYIIEEDVDFNKIGDYDVNVIAKDANGNESSKSFIVHVIDNEAPVITIADDGQVIKYNIGDPLPDFKHFITIKDNYDTDIPINKLMVLDDDVNYDQYGIYPIVYGVYDVSGNFGFASGLVIVTDNIAPEIVLDVEEFSFYTTNDHPDYLHGVSATDNISQDITSRILIDDSQVDYEHEGTYQLTYLVWDLAGNVTCKQIKVHILLDKIAPVITGAKDISVEYGTPESQIDYFDGLTFTDDVDQDVNYGVNTDQVNFSKLGSYDIIYVAKDKAGNEVKVTRKLVVVDTKSPLLIGVKNISVKEGNKNPFTKFKALDNYDGDLTDKIEILGDYDLHKAGKYTLTIKVKDSSDNITTDTFTLTVEDSNTTAIIIISAIIGICIIGCGGVLFYMNKDKIFKNKEE